jgi:ABC-type multidrug transport system fused ATPase/permease subunit
VSPGESIRDALDLGHLRAEGTADHLRSSDVRRILARGAALLRPFAGHLAAFIVLSLATVGFFVGTGIWLGLRVVWDLVGQGTPPAAWELDLLGIAPPLDGTVSRSAIAAAAAPRLVLLAFAGSAVGLLFRYYGIWILQLVNQRLRLALFDRAQALSLRFHAEARVGDLIYRLYQDSAMVTQFLQTLVLGPLIASGTCVIGFVTLAVLAPSYALACLVALPLVVLVVAVASRPLRARFRRARESQSDLTSTVQESALGIRAIKAYGNEAQALRRFEAASRSALRRALAARGLYAVYQSVLFTVVAAGMLGIALVATGRAADEPVLAWPILGMTTFGLAAYNAAKALSGMALDSMRGIATLWGGAQDMVVGLDRVFETLDRVPDVRDAPDATPIPRFAHTLELRDVTFAYEPGIPALEHVSLVARAGEVVAVVGPTGAGKSTLLGLVARFFDPDAGAVLVDGRDLRSATVRSVREQTAIALQEHVLFSASVRDNLRYGRPGATDAAIRAAAALACADDFVGALPHGYDTFLGERGTKLSTGQRQRLGIARALLKDAPILLLDEPTASLDAETELRLLANLRTWAADRLVLLVTHRLGVLAGVDHVVFLERGHVAGFGSHAELAARADGRYRAFVAAQRAPLAGGAGPVADGVA